MSPHLKEQLIGVIDEQLKMNDPLATRETFERLIGAGHSDTRAKEMIAAVLVKEMTFMLENKLPFDEARYAEKLLKLK